MTHKNQSGENRSGPVVERRTSPRFPFEQPVSYRVLDAGLARPVSSGVTIDMSSAGILFHTPEPVDEGKRLELCVRWPVTLEGGCPLKLVAVGRVVRAELGRAAMRIEKYEFRTRGSGSLLAETSTPAFPPVR
jgi:hypothetical protein